MGEADPRSTAEATLEEILEALQTPSAEDEIPFSCALCFLGARSVERTLRALFAEFVNDPQTRDRFRQSRGFCRPHTALLVGMGDALGIAILYNDLAEQTRQRWQTAYGARRPRLALLKSRAASRPALPCLACEAERDADERYAAALALGLAHARTWQTLEQSSGFCVAHSEQVLALASPELAERFRKWEEDRLQALEAELQEIIRKNDYRFRHEAWGPEKDAWLRALRKLRR